MNIDCANSLPQWPSKDAGYENDVEVMRTTTGTLVRKTFRRRERFLAELSATVALKGSGRVPVLREVCHDRMVIVREWAPGCPIALCGLTATNAATTVHNVATCLRDIHACTAVGWGPLEDSVPSGWIDYLDRRLHLRLRQAWSLLGEPLRLHSWAQSRLRQIPVPQRPAVLHHDLKPANIIVSDGFVMLVDLEHAKGGDPLCDLAKLKWRVFGDAPELWTLFAAAYAASTREEVHERTVDFYLAMHCLGAVAYAASFPNPSYLRHLTSAMSLLERLVSRP